MRLQKLERIGCSLRKATVAGDVGQPHGKTSEYNCETPGRCPSPGRKSLSEHLRPLDRHCRRSARSPWNAAVAGDVGQPHGKTSEFGCETPVSCPPPGRKSLSEHCARSNAIAGVQPTIQSHGPQSKHLEHKPGGLCAGTAREQGKAGPGSRQRSKNCDSFMSCVGWGPPESEGWREAGLAQTSQTYEGHVGCGRVCGAWN